MPERLRMTIVCFHISTALYVLLGIAFLFIFINLPPSPELPRSFGLFTGIFIFIFCLAVAAGVEVIVSGLKQLKYWAWVAGIVTCVFYITSAFLILGGLWGLLDSETQAAIQQSRRR